VSEANAGMIRMPGGEFYGNARLVHRVNLDAVNASGNRAGSLLSSEPLQTGARQ
jgi:hypothetical protein